MKTKILSVFLTIVFLICAIPTFSVSAAKGNLSMTPSSSNVTVESSVTVNIVFKADSGKIASIYSTVKYDTEKVSLVDKTGDDGTTIKGDAGITTLIFEAPSSGILPVEVRYTLTFKTLTVGESNISLTTSEFLGCENEASVLKSYDLGSPTNSVTVTASNPTLSGNANLKSLKPSRGTLTPKFDPDVTEYKISVGHDVTSLSFSVTTDHSEAKTSINGKNALEVGKNTRVVTVTAPNGTTKKYTIVITRAAAPSTTTGTNPTTTGTTLPRPADDALDVVIDGKEMTILDTQASVDLPAGFTWSNLTINLVEVPAAVNAETGMTLLYLVSEDKTGDGFYIYDQAADTFTLFRALSVTGGTYLLYDLPAGKTLAGTVQGILAYDGGEVSALVYEDETLSDYYIVWAAPAGGEAGWYTYDKKEGTLQRYHAVNAEGGIDTPTTPSDKDVVTPPVKDEPAFSMGDFFRNNQKILLIGGIVLAGIVVIILLFVMLSAGGRKKGKH